jgi:hypothetical protein
MRKRLTSGHQESGRIETLYEIQELERLASIHHGRRAADNG